MCLPSVGRKTNVHRDTAAACAARCVTVAYTPVKVTRSKTHSYETRKKSSLAAACQSSILENLSVLINNACVPCYDVQVTDDSKIFDISIAKRRQYEKFEISGIIFVTHCKTQFTRGLDGKEVTRIRLTGETKKGDFLRPGSDSRIAMLKERATKNEEAEPRIGVITKVAFRDPTTRYNARSLPCANDMAHTREPRTSATA